MQEVEVASTSKPTPELLRVPKSTGTHGDTLVAWGLAILSSEVLECDYVELHDEGDAFHILLGEAGVDLDEELSFPPTSQLDWLSSTQNNRFPTTEFKGRQVNRDELREAAERARQAARATATPVEGDAPLVTSPMDVRLYPLYQVLTNPGTQWAGYNSMVENLQPLMSPAGWQLVVDLYHPTEPLPPPEIDSRIKALGLAQRGARWRNPPGFIYPGLNKGPTMLLRTAAGTIVGNSSRDWMMSDRNDRSIVEIYLAYLGYFGVAQVLTSREERVVVVPAPWKVRVPDAVDKFRGVSLRYSSIYSYTASMSALQYAKAVADYLLELQRVDPEAAARSGLVLTGVHVSRYWMPSGNTYAPRYTGSVPMPGWLAPIRKEAITTARETVEYHRNRLRQVRGGGEESKMPNEKREAIRLYERSLDGDAADWFRAVAAWYDANREGGDDEALLRSMWRWDEVRRIALALEQDLNQIIDSEAFKRVAGAIRNATLSARMARQRGGTGPSGDGEGAVPGRSPFSPQYDLVTTLMSAAERHYLDFLQELYIFAAKFNDETMRRIGPEGRRALIRQEDLEQITEWVTAEQRRQLVPFALLAFGTSRRGDRPAEPTEIGSPEIEEGSGSTEAEGGTLGPAIDE